MATLKSKFMVARDIGGGYFEIKNIKHGDDLGVVEWYERWKQFVFCPYANCDFSADCLDSISRFLKDLNAERKGG